MTGPTSDAPATAGSPAEPPRSDRIADGPARLRLGIAVVCLIAGWSIVVLPTVYAPRVLVGVALAVVGLVLVPIRSLPAGAALPYRVWLVINALALALPVIGLFSSWSNSTLLLAGVIALVASVHLAALAGQRVAADAGLDDLARRFGAHLKIAAVGDAVLLVALALWALDGAVGSMLLAGGAVAGTSAAALLYGWGGLQVGVDAADLTSAAAERDHG